MITPFVTGSRAYGTPTDASDVDLCVLVDAQTLSALRAAAEGKVTVARAPAGGSLSARDLKEDPGDSLYFGKLNLIAHTDPRAYAAWRDATAALTARRPVSREEAIRTIKSAVKEAVK